MDDPQRITFLWATISRIDGYIVSTNAKASLLLAFNTFVLGGIAFQANDFLAPIRNDFWLVTGALALIILLVVASLASLLIALSVVQPFLRSSKGFSSYRSLIYFGDIAEAKDGRSYAHNIENSDSHALFVDLARQVHVLSSIANSKFQRLRHATRCAVFLQCPVLLVLLVIHLVTAAGGTP